MGLAVLLTLILAQADVSKFCSSPGADAKALVIAGGAAYQAAKYQDAKLCFSQALKLDPTSVSAKLYLGYSLMALYVPGDKTAANVDTALAARQRFVDVLDQDPANKDAIASVAMLAYQQQNFEDARIWYGKLLAADPNSKEPYYMLGVIAYAESNVLLQKARLDLGMKPEDPGPLKDLTVRADVRRQDMDRVEQGIAHLKKVLTIDPQNDDAMTYLNLLYRQRADLQGEVAYKQDVATAGQWMQKATAAKNKKLAPGAK